MVRSLIVVDRRPASSGKIVAREFFHTSHRLYRDYHISMTKFHLRATTAACSPRPAGEKKEEPLLAMMIQSETITL